MKTSINFFLFIFLIIVFSTKNVFSENNQILDLLSICADKNYVKLDVEEIDKKTYENNSNYQSLQNNLDILTRQKNEVANRYISERTKFVSEFPEPSSDTYSKKQWEEKMKWERNKSKRLSPFIEDLEKTIDDIAKFQEIINKDIKRLSLIYLEQKSIYEKSKSVNGYIDSVQKCEDQYENYPITFKLKWS